MHWRILTTLLAISSLRFFPVCLRCSVRVMTEGVAPFLAAHVTHLQLCQTKPTFIALLTILKKKEIVTQLLSVIVECLQSHLQTQGKQAGSIDPYDCPDRPMRHEKDRILSQSVWWTFVCILQLVRKAVPIPLHSCWSNSRPTDQFHRTGCGGAVSQNWAGAVGALRCVFFRNEAEGVV